MSKNPSFIERCLAGDVLIEQIDDFVDRWHENPEGIDLQDYLGMTEEEYSLWVPVPGALTYIVRARREVKRLVDVIIDASGELPAGVHVTDRSQIVRLQKWVKSNQEMHRLS